MAPQLRDVGPRFTFCPPGIIEHREIKIDHGIGFLAPCRVIGLRHMLPVRGLERLHIEAVTFQLGIDFFLVAVEGFDFLVQPLDAGGETAKLIKC